MPILHLNSKEFGITLKFMHLLTFLTFKFCERSNSQFESAFFIQKINQRKKYLQKY